MEYKEKKLKNYESFLETLNAIDNVEFIKDSLAKANVLIYKEKKFIIDDPEYDTNIFVENEDVITTIIKNKKEKLGVLVFASRSINNYTCTKDSQEDKIFRSSTLFKLIDNSYCYQEFYLENKPKKDYENTNNSLYIKNSLVFKNESILKKEDWTYVDFILSCPPDMSKLEISRAEQIKLLYKKLINVICAAIDNKVEVLILGAYGCGYSFNSPVVVATVFKGILYEYGGFFKKIIFSIDGNESFDSNYKTFKKILINE